MSIFKKSTGAAIILAASLFVSEAQAAQTIVISGASGNFGDSAVTCAEAGPCAFTRTFEFVTPSGFNLSSLDISSVETSSLTNIDFSSVTFNNVNFNILSTGTQEFRNLLNQNLKNGANNVLAVAGTTGGNAAFSGNLSFASVAAVPEPTTWIMMVLGMAGVGFSLRSKKQGIRVRFA